MTNQEKESITQDEDASNEEIESSESLLDEENLPLKIEKLNDQLLRTLAENQNLRRRAQKDVEEAHSYAIGKFVKDLLSVADNFQRALELVAEDLDEKNEFKPFVEGIELTHKELLRALEKHNVEKHCPINEQFDHNLHQALFDVPTTEHQTGIVLQVIQPGYTLNGRLLRPAMVGVSKNTSA